MTAFRTIAAGIILLSTTVAAIHFASNHRQTDTAAVNVDDGLNAESIRAANELITLAVGQQMAMNLAPEHRDAVARLIDARSRVQNPEEMIPASFCYAPGTSPDLISILEQAQATGPGGYQQTGRWSNTATNGGGLGQGQPTTLRYSFVPDGTFVPNVTGYTGNSDLFARMNTIYGTPAVWQAHFASVFNRWSQLCGLTYVFEPNDDGANHHQNAGVIGVRGDLRIAGIFLDGNSNVLAYNRFPNDGDMVIDTGDNFFSTTSSNSLRLRNVVSHEHGHGMGLLHVCPVNSSKLMEPFISTSYDGPRHDDIRNAQRHYGDAFEPDNTAATANDLGTIAVGGSVSITNPSAPSVSNGALLSIDANGEQDYFQFNITEGASVSVTVTPIGLNYDDSPQACGGSSGCCSGNFTDSLVAADLAVQVIGTNGTTVLNTASSEPVGSPETLTNVILPTTGTFYIRVFETDAPTESQLYHLTVSINNLPFSITLPNGAPSMLTAGQDNSFDVNIDPGADTLVPGSPRLYYRYDGGSFISVPLSPQGGTLYTATLPATGCAATPEFYISAEGDIVGVRTLPAGGESDPFVVAIGSEDILVNHNFQTTAGWTVSDVPNGGGTFDGTWSRGVPAGGGLRGDPPSDFDGSGACWLTDNAAGNTDVDNGETILTSPVFDITSLTNPTVSYARWYSNTFGGAPQADVFTVEVSDNGGGSWVTLEVVGPTTTSPNPEVDGDWFQKTYPIGPPLINVTNQFRIRFRASDDGDGSVVEAGVDAFRISGVSCFLDCNTNGIADQTEPDCDGNFIPDACEVVGDDCNTNGVPDGCEGGDCNTNGTLDICDANGSVDCNSNGIPDECDVIRTQTSFARSQSLGALECTAVAAADYDKDGDIDVVATRAFFDRIRLYPNDGSGTHSSDTILVVGDNPSDVILADLNNDTWLDIAVTNRDQDTISVLLNLGEISGTWQGFATEVQYSGSEPTAIVAADFNNDGFLDLAITRNDGARVRVLQNDGFGGFVGLGGWDVGGNPSDLVVGDFDEDGLPDVATANFGTDDITILLNGGNTGPVWNGFLAGSGYSATAPTSLVTADFDGDGHLDIAVTRSNAARVRTLLGNGDGTFTSNSQLVVGDNPSAVIAADFDNDGNVDLAATNRDSNTVSILYNRGVIGGLGWQGFLGNIDFATENNPVALVTYDRDADGKLDLAVANLSPGSVGFHLNATVLAVSEDCNTNALPDECEGFPDINTNGLIDICEPLTVDCNSNGIADNLETDCNTNGQPDDCDSFTDCNNNSIPDECDVLLGDCNMNGIPDECESDCNTNLVPDDCDGLADCNTNDAPDVCESLDDCNTNAMPDVCESITDCNTDGTPDECQLGADCNANGIPDVCDLVGNDCNTNGQPDDCEAFADCNTNNVPDECDIASLASTDVNANDVPDECEAPSCATCPGDLNGDAVVDGRDVQCFVECLISGTTSSCATCDCADFDADLDIDADDLNAFVSLLLNGPVNCP